MRFREARAAAEDPKIEIAPLIDVVFLLLLFFVLTTTFSRQSAIDVVLPESSQSALEMTRKELMVAISADGRIVFDGDVVETSTLLGLLAERSAADPDQVLLLVADRAVPHGVVVEVMDLAKEAGLRRLSIATREVGLPALD